MSTKYRIGIQDRDDHTQKVTVERNKGWLHSWEVLCGLKATSHSPFWGDPEYVSGSDFGDVYAAREFINRKIEEDLKVAQRKLVGKVRYTEYP